MKAKHRYYLSISVSIIILGFLIFHSLSRPFLLGTWLIGILFFLLIVFTTTFGVPLGGGTVSLLPMTTIAAFLVLDSLPTAWAAFWGAIVSQFIRQRYGPKLGLGKSSSSLIAIAIGATNASMHTISILVGSLVFHRVGGTVPITEFSFQTLFPTFLLALTHLTMNLSLAAGYLALREIDHLKMYLRSLPNLLVYEAAPLIFAPLMALIYTRLGIGPFILFALTLIVTSLTTKQLALTSRGLERRIQELDSLQAVGQALSASLRLETILPAIYDQVAKLMPAENFYVALYYPEENEVTFPLAIEENQPVKWASRQTGHGLTEYVLRSGDPLLITTNIESKLQDLGIASIGRSASSWLGVPLMTGDEILGVIAVQSYTEDELYEDSHKNVLTTIATQAAIAIQNARLYERTDEALSRRVQELNSILRTSAEGILLLSRDWQVLAANRALANFLEIAQVQLTGGELENLHLNEHTPWLSLIKYPFSKLKADCKTLSIGNTESKQARFLTPSQRHLERTLTPVFDRQDQIVGWLLVFRDITEEVKLARLREDMTHMLVHDLRTPLTSLRGSLWILNTNLEDYPKKDDHTEEMLAMAERSTNRMMNMVNSLLDIAKLEDGQMPLYTEKIKVSKLLEESIAQVSSLAESAEIQLSVNTQSDLPTLKVDPGHIRRTIINLLDNAIKFTPNGGEVHLQASLDQKKSTESIIIQVSDTGPGISKESQKRLFEKFQTDPKTQGRRRGTGLGLAYCKLVVEAHAGEVWVESEIDQGATFLIRLPIGP